MLVKKNKTYGRLLAVAPVGYNKHNQSLWKFVCTCGKEISVVPSRVTRGVLKSCGCLRKEIGKKQLTTHGMRGYRIYDIWCGMKQRCDDKKSPNYKHYGGRGISYEERWSKFENFYADMKDGYDNKKSLDRLDNNGNYCKENCRWATRVEQANNKSTTLYIKYRTENKTLAEWCRELNIKYVKTWLRIYRYKWSPEKAFQN